MAPWYNVRPADAIRTGIVRWSPKPNSFVIEFWRNYLSERRQKVALVVKSR